VLSEMNATVREYLIDRAYAGKTISYQELPIACGLKLDLSLELHRAQIGRILGDISVYEHQAGRPLLSAVAVLAETKLLSDGFYRLAEQLGIGPVKRLKQDFFGEMKMGRCFKFWRWPRNYTDFKLL
jgi:hypothetical protein